MALKAEKSIDNTTEEKIKSAINPSIDSDI